MRITSLVEESFRVGLDLKGATEKKEKLLQGKREGREDRYHKPGAYFFAG